MGDTVRGDSIRIDGTGKYDHVDCGEFTVDGSGKVSGDLYADEASVNGTAKVGGDVDVGELDVDGTVKVSESVRADRVDVDGTAKVDGDVSAETYRTDGTTKVGGDASVDHLHSDGTTKIDGNLDAHEVESDGTAKVRGSVVAAEGHFDGTVKVRGLTDVTDLSVDGTGKFADVNADALAARGTVHAGAVRVREFDLALDGDSEVEALHATGVAVRRRGGADASLGERLLNRGDPVLEVGLVAGETVDLDATLAETVVGERVALGPDAEVGVVYADDLDADDDATVGEVRDREDYDGE